GSTFPLGTTAVNCTVSDGNGNTATAGFHVTVRDTIAPTVQCASADTSWHNANQSANCTATDSGSGPASQSITLITNVLPGSETSNASTNSAPACDAVSNCAIAGPVSGFKIDRKAPTGITFSGGPSNGSSYPFGSVPSVPTCTATDGGSGLASCIVAGYSTALGPQTLTATATDNVLNVSSAVLNYTVSPWTLKGFYQPTDMNGVYNTVKNGSTVPLKFEIFAGSTELTNIAAVKSVTQLQIVCGTNPEDVVEETVTTTGGTVLRYDSSVGQFIDNWKTPSGSIEVGKCYRVTMTAQDGSTLSAFFKLK
ncbi:MAG TPA: PxKF domain-containing protein, partial [Caldilineaceae bacterium]|nr:PxKF domain-containing protein [Caldilineaceae bacterium]